MQQLTFQQLSSADDPDIPGFLSAYQHPGVARYLNISDHYFRYVSSTENVFFYKVYDQHRLVGAVHLEMQDTTLFMILLVLPEHQHTGLGTRILHTIQADVCLLRYDRIEVSIDEHNASSLRLFTKAGFVRGIQEDELISFTWQRKSAAHQNTPV